MTIAMLDTKDCKCNNLLHTSIVIYNHVALV